MNSQPHAPTTPIQSASPYAAHVGADRHAAVGAWRADICGGCCDDCCSCVIPTFVPCVGIGEAACALMDQSSAIRVAAVFGVLVLGAYVSDALFWFKSWNFQTEIVYESYYDYWSSTYHYYNMEVSIGGLPYALLVISFACSVLYCIGLCLFRGSFREKLHLPGDCCTDFLTSFCCCCCAVAQMRSHVKRSRVAQGVDTLPAYRAV